jgi:hypothetical protein
MNDIHPVSSSMPDAEGDSFRITFANLDDVDALVALHLKCFSNEDHIAVMFGEDFIRTAYKWFVTDSKTFVLIAKKEALQALPRRPWLKHNQSCWRTE